ncbi:MAG TPA: hypothetical protein DCS93_35320 [Microscillaceae bacterium]|nr:hypothetical protein [Microscillaceae bacterium]
MNNFLIVGAVQALFLALLVLSKQKKALADYLLVGWFLVSAAHIFFFYTSLHQSLTHNQRWLIMGTGLPFLQGATLFFYVNALIKPRLHWFIYLLHLSPFVIYTISFIVYQQLYPQAYEVLDGTLLVQQKLPWLMWHHGVFKAIAGIGYIMWSLFILVRYQLELPRHYSFQEKINLNWLKYWLITTLGMALITVGVIVLGADLKFLQISTTYQIVAILFLLLIFVMGFFGFRQTSILVDKRLPAGNEQEAKQAKEAQIKKEQIKKENTVKYQNSGLTDRQAAIYQQQLLHYMETHQPYLASKLTLVQLATQLDMSTHHLSQIMNEQLGKNFFEFINHYRVETIKEKLQNPKFTHYTLLGIALESGFNSKTSFNTVFKKITGMTPSQYQKSLDK